MDPVSTTAMAGGLTTVGGKALKMPQMVAPSGALTAPLPKLVPKPEMARALAALEASPLTKATQIFRRHLGHVPNLESQLRSLSQNQFRPKMKRGILGELRAATRLEKLGTGVLDVSRNVYEIGPDLKMRKFTDLDVVTKAGSVVEVKDHASLLNLSGIQDKADRLLAVREAGLTVDGVSVRSLYVYAPGGVSDAARSYLAERGITVIESISQLRMVQ